MERRVSKGTENRKLPSIKYLAGSLEPLKLAGAAFATLSEPVGLGWARRVWQFVSQRTRGGRRQLNPFVHRVVLAAGHTFQHLYFAMEKFPQRAEEGLQKAKKFQAALMISSFKPF
jgi:hypothetical protein